MGKEKKEIWKDIPGYEGLYQASTFGRIKSLSRKVKTKNGSLRLMNEKILKQSKYGNYLSVVLRNNNESKGFNTHQLICITFLNHKPNGNKNVIDHIDSDKHNNQVDNLRIVSTYFNSSVDIDKTKTTSIYTGVYFNKSNNKWRSVIQINKKKIHLGYFIDEYDAHLAYQNKLKEVCNG